MQPISVCFDVAKFAGFQWKSAAVRRAEGLIHMIYKFFGSSLGKI